MTALYLSAIEHVHGDRRSIAELSGQLDAELLHPDSGLSRYRASDLEIWQLAAAAGTRTLTLGPEPPDLVVYVTENDHDSSDSMPRLMQALDLPAARYLRVSGHDCGNLGPALALARQALASGENSRVLLVLADKALDGDRNPANRLSVISDGAVACLVTGTPSGLDGAEFAVRAVTTITDIQAASSAAVGSAAADQRVLSTVTLSVAGVTAVTAQTGRELADFDHLVFPNYRKGIQEFLCSAMGSPPEHLLVGPMAEFGHCFSADILMTLGHCAGTGQIRPGDHVLASCDGAASLTALAAERLG
jgi:3-oxoacyl-[acyl-carrier-protein] synthase III